MRSVDSRLVDFLDRFDMPRDEAKADAKSEGKEDDAGGKGAKGEPTPTVSVTKIEVEPNDCALEDPLDLSIEFILDGEVTDAWWEIKARLARGGCGESARNIDRASHPSRAQYLVDSVRNRYVEGARVLRSPRWCVGFGVS